MIYGDILRDYWEKSALNRGTPARENFTNTGNGAR